MRNYYEKLNERIISKSNGKGKRLEDASNFSYIYKAYVAHYLRIISKLCSKFPLLIPIVEEHEISTEQLEKDLPFPWLLDFLRSTHPGAEKISFPEYVLLTMCFHNDMDTKELFLSLSERAFSFTKQENGTFVSSSQQQTIKYLTKLRKGLLRSSEPGYFKSYLCVERFEQLIYLHNEILNQFKYSCFRDGEWEKREMMKSLKTFNYIAEHFSPEDGELILESRFYKSFQAAYESYLELLFTEKTGKEYKKNLEAVHYYLNKRLNKGLLNQKTEDLLKKAAQNSLILREPVDSLTEEPQINSNFGSGKDEPPINEDLTVNLSKKSIS